MKRIKNAEKRISLSKLNKTNKNYDVKSLGCWCFCVGDNSSSNSRSNYSN